MDTYIIITKIPARQGVINGIPEKITIDETQGESVDSVVERLHVPLGGYCLVIREDNTTKVTSRIVNNIEPKK